MLAQPRSFVLVLVLVGLPVAACHRTSDSPTSNPPIIVTQPVRQVVGVGQRATFSVVAAGIGTLRFEWRKNGVPEPVAAEDVTERPLVPSAYTSFPLSAEDDGARYSVRVSDSSGRSVISDEAVVALLEFARTGPLASARTGHTSTLLPSGEVLVAGGQSFSYWTDGSTTAPPPAPAVQEATAETYDRASETWTAAGPLGEARAYHSATLLASGKVLVAGGDPGRASAELYDPVTRSWSATGSLSTSRSGHHAVLLPSGKVLVFGGSAWESTTSTWVKVATAELYDPQGGTWSAAAAPSDAGPAVLLPSGRVLSVASTSAALYDPAADAWSTTDAPTNGPGGTPFLLPSGNVLSIDSTGTTAVYAPDTGSWSAPQPHPRRFHDATLCMLSSGDVLASGGRVEAWGSVSSSTAATASVYDPPTGTWALLPDSTLTRAGHRCTALSSGEVLLTGGSYVLQTNRTRAGTVAVVELFGSPR